MDNEPLDLDHVINVLSKLFIVTVIFVGIGTVGSLGYWLIAVIIRIAGAV